MANRGFSKPKLNAGIAGAVRVGGVAAILVGMHEMEVAGGETTLSGILIGGGILPAIFGLGMVGNFLCDVRVIERIRRGEQGIGRCIVTAGELDAFRESNKQRNALGPAYNNNFKPPRRSPPEGIEVILSRTGCWSAAPISGGDDGHVSFRRVQTLAGSPMCIEFGSVETTFSNVSTIRIGRSYSVLRIPIGRTGTDAAARVLAYFKHVDARKNIVRRGFYPSRIRIGLWSALNFAVIAVASFGLEALETDFGLVPLLMAVIGTIAAIAGLALALIARLLHQRQLHGS